MALGCAGRVANGINTVHLSYVREKTGHALAGARQWIPAEDIRPCQTRAAEGIFTLGERVTAATDWLAAETTKIPMVQTQVLSADSAVGADEVMKAFRADLASGTGTPVRPRA